MPTVSLHRTVYMTSVAVRKARTACVLQSLHMYMHAQKQESTSVAGGRPSVVSKTQNTVMLYCGNRERPSLSQTADHMQDACIKKQE